MEPVWIGAEDVRRLLPMDRCIDAMALAMTGLRAGRIVLPQRSFSPLADGSGTLGLMPGSSLEPEVYGAKVISLHPENPRHARPVIQGFVALFEHETGRPLAFVEGASLTAIRTAAASGLATRELARSDARTLGVFGAGVQAGTHLDAVLAVRAIEEVRVWARDEARAAAFCRLQSERHQVELRPASPEDAAACDVVCTVTGSPEPILRGEWVRTGAHVNLVGAHTLSTREADAALMRRAEIYVDTWESAKAESGDVDLAVREGAIAWDDVRGEIAEVLGGEADGRTGDEQITVYVSLGVAAQDLVAAELVYRRFVEEGSS
ncbi:MAG: ornithine cyclodeaminase family protein [Acidobacteria bacterium]|nr:MAG: ornithine cyclodeaminase family protein [Acidobacteriota bacterium]REK03323.1 MAG: ornithine cyclodeaminase family protein [Acidobacteriota bacterium]